jgi:hypothetical protein
MYFDKFAMNTPTYMEAPGLKKAMTTAPLAKSPMKAPHTELDRLIQEREELVGSGCYTVEDPLIQEMDRQIHSNKLKL